MGKITVKGRFIRERLRSPARFIRGSFRTIVSGKHRIIRGRLKTTGLFATQAQLHPKRERTGRGKKFQCKNEKCRRLSRK